MPPKKGEAHTGSPPAGPGGAGPMVVTPGEAPQAAGQLPQVPEPQTGVLRYGANVVLGDVGAMGREEIRSKRGFAVGSCGSSWGWADLLQGETFSRS